VGRFPGLYGWGVVRLSTGWRTAFVVTIVVLALGWTVRRRWTRPSPVSLRLLVLAAMPVLLLLAAALSSYATFRRNGEIRGMAPRYVYRCWP
jgi:hypothetical protein